MVKRLQNHVSPSMAVALLALFVALTGTGYAALKVNGRDIKKRSIPGNRLVNNGVTGRQVNEARLGTVPRAQNADTLAGLAPSAFLQDPSAFLGAGAKAADANQLDGLDSTAFLGATAKAADANQLDGLDSTAFLGAAAKAANSDQLDGIDSAGFIQGGGNVDGQAIAMPPNTTNNLGPAMGGLVRFRYQCPFNLGGNGAFRITNASTGPANLFVDSGGANPDYIQLGAGGFVDYPAAFSGESFFIQIQGAPGVVLASAATVHRGASNDCHAQALGVLGQ
jgi:hypothetical protein